jgi:outer membrane cobalamin receptor
LSFGTSLILSSISARAQDTTNEFEGVTVHGSTNFSPETKFTADDIRKLAPFDLGHLLQNSTGIAVRDYGGLGGMKTLSIRGLGGEHTKLIVNGQTVTNAQNGQTDYGLVQLDNVEYVKLSSGVNSEPLIPVSAQVMGSSVVLTTFENSFSSHKHQIRASSTLGSFGQQEIFGSYKYAKNRHFLSFSTKYRQAEGNYDYRIPFGDDWITGTRRNNSLQESFISFGAGIKTHIDTLKQRYHILKINGELNSSEKQLPGAVILYNDHSDESLSQNRNRFGLNYSVLHKKTKVLFHGGFNQQDLNYFDPTYFNQAGFIDNRYTTSNFQVGTSIKHDILKGLSIHTGTDIEQTNLQSNRPELGAPRRISSASMFGLDFQNAPIEVRARLFYQYFDDINRIVHHSKAVHRFNPQIELSTSDKFSKTTSLLAWAKKTMRPPSFNEMYFSQIGNTALIPEDTWQVNLGAIVNRRIHSTPFNFKINSYYNRVSNKILAVPTQNLFIWSITNVGEVEIKGVDLEAKIHQELRKTVHIQWHGNLTFQQVIDVSDEHSPTYRHQLLYTPKWTSNNTFSLYIKDIAIHQTTYYVGKRYSLNQNIPSNELASFIVADVSVEYQLRIQKMHTLKLQAGVRNIANSSYAYIRNFVMPGRNYFIKLSYGLH